MNSGSFASSYVETVRLLDLTCHNFRTLSVRHPRNSVTKYPLFLGNTLTPAPRNNAARYSHVVAKALCARGYRQLVGSGAGPRTQAHLWARQDRGHCPCDASGQAKRDDAMELP